MPSTPPLILLISQDVTLIYLIERYAERGGYAVHAEPMLPALFAVRDLQPATVLFTSIGSMEAAQAQMAELVSWEIPLLVCSFVNDQARARELGADYCLLHPLAYDSFLAALTITGAPAGTPDGRSSAASRELNGPEEAV